MLSPGTDAARAAAVPAPVRAASARWRVLLVLVVLGGELLSVRWPAMREQLGVENFGMWFIDSYAILAASDTARAGGDPYVAMPTDPLDRKHSYSRWWFVLGNLGLTQKDNFLFGGACVATFLVLLLAWLRPDSGAEAAWFAALCLAPPLLLLVNRANNDTVVCILLLLAFGWMRAPETWRLALAVAALGLATGLKFYPAAAAGAFLVVRPPRRLVTALLAAAVVVGSAVLAVRADFDRAVFPETHPVGTFGADVIGDVLHWPAGLTRGVALLVLTAGAILAWRRGATRGLADEARAPLSERLLFVAAALILLGCFVARISYYYRWVFALLLAPWLWRQRRAPGPEGAAVRAMIVLLPVTMWMDGIFFLCGNLAGPFSRAQAETITRAWKLVSQPFVWLILTLLAGWMLDLAVATVRDLRAAVSAAPRAASRR